MNGKEQGYEYMDSDSEKRHFLLSSNIVSPSACNGHGATGYSPSKSLSNARTDPLCKPHPKAICAHIAR
jgi:hypothetical protein